MKTTAFGFWWRYQRSRFYRKKYETETERQVLLKHFDHLIKYANDIIILTDEHLNIWGINDRAVEAYGYTREEFLQFTMVQLYASETAKEVAAQITSVNEQRDGRNETIHQRKDGTTFSVEASVHPIEIEGKKFYQAIIRDITEDKRTEEALRESEEKYRNLVENSLEGIGLSKENRIIYANKALLDIFGYEDLEEFLSIPLLEHVAPESQTTIMEMQRKFRNKEQYEKRFTYKIIRKDGKIRDTEISTDHVKIGSDIYTQSTFRDITERKRTEEALCESEEKYRSIYNNSQIGILFTKPDGTILSANDFACRLFGTTEEEICRAGRNAIVDATDPRLQKLLEERKRVGIGSGELTFIRADGTKFEGEISSAVFLDREGIEKTSMLIQDLTERKQAEQALRDSQRMLQIVLDSIPSAVFWKDRNSIYLGGNSTWLKEAGLKTSEDVVGKSDYNLPWTKKQADSFREDDRRVMKSGVPEYGIIESYLRADGTNAWALTNKVPLRDIEGNVIGILGTFDDITERKRAEEALQDSEKRFSTIFRASPIGISITNIADGKIIDVNPAFSTILGYPKDEIIGRTTLELGLWYESEDREKVVKTLYEKGFVHDFETKYRSKSGEIGNLLVSAEIIELADAAYMLGIFFDITERKQAEEALWQSNSFNEMLLQTMPFGMDIVDEQGNILFISDAMIKLIGADALGQCCWAIYKDDKKQCQDCPLYKGIEFGEVETLESNGVLGGRTFQISHTGIIFKEKKAILEVFQDVTEQKTLQQELLQMQKMESIGVLAGGIAHDFNNILAIILAYSSALEQAAGDKKKVYEYSRIITQAVNRGAALVHQILTFARQTDMVLAPISVANLISELISMLRQTFPKVINLLEIIDKNIPFIDADRTQIHQAILNLCVNSRDAMPNGGTITIKAEKQMKDQVRERFSAADKDSYICISVIDTGEGMNEATRLRIFDPFFTTKEKGKGTGLGLAVVYGIVHVHHGFIDVESEVGHGTTFRLYFPCQLENENVINDSFIIESSEAGGTETVLLVEDEIALLDMVRSLLESEGYKVYTAQDGNEAVNEYVRHKQEIDIVLTDMGLPGMIGKEVFLKLREIDPDVRVILASGFFEPDMKTELYNAGARGLIQKPYHLDEVLRKLREVLNERRG